MQMSNSVVAMTARLAQVGLGKADGLPADLAVVSAVDRIGEEPFERERVQRAEERLLRDAADGDLPAREHLEDPVLLLRRDLDEPLAEALLRPEVEQRREPIEG